MPGCGRHEAGASATGRILSGAGTAVRRGGVRTILWMSLLSAWPVTEVMRHLGWLPAGALPALAEGAAITGAAVTGLLWLRAVRRRQQREWREGAGRAIPGGSADDGQWRHLVETALQDHAAEMDALREALASTCRDAGVPLRPSLSIVPRQDAG